MNMHRRTATAVMTCAAGLSLTACSVGITSARPETSPSSIASHTGSSPTASSSHSASPSPATVTMVSVNAPIHGFPVPAGARVAFNISCPKSIGIAVSPVTPSQASAFYATELARAGYKVEGNSTMADPNTGTPDGLTEIEFSGHGYTGSIITVANFGAAASAGPSGGPPIAMPSGLDKNVEEVTMSVPGTPDSYNCPGF